MSHVDALSRNAVENILRIEAEDWLMAGQMTDAKLNALKEILSKPPQDQYAESVHRDYQLKDNRLFRKRDQDELWVVPRGMRREIVKSCHDEFGHFALDKTLKKISESYYVTTYINSCIPCLYHKKKRGRKEGFLHPIDKVPIPFHTIHVDHLGPFNRSSGGSKYVLVIIEAFTKFTFLKAVNDIKTAPVIRQLKIISNTYGSPTRIITDRGTAFTSKPFEKYCEECAILHIKNAVATPRANGQVERYNATILTSLSSSIESEEDWEKALPKVQFAMNNVVNSSTNKTASELLMSYRPRSEADAKLTNVIQPNRPVVTDLNIIREDVRKRTRQEQEKQCRRFNKRRGTPHFYKVGDLIAVIKQKTGEGSKKLLPWYKGPFVITKILPNDRYAIEDMKGAVRSYRTPHKSIEAVDHMKPWVSRGCLSSTSESEGDEH